MNNWLAVVGSIVAVGALYVVAPVVALTYRRFRGPRTVTCPENREPAEIEVSARHAAVTAAFGRPDIEITRCSRWPVHERCGRECRSEV